MWVLHFVAQPILYRLLFWLGLIMIATSSLAKTEYGISLFWGIPTYEAGVTYTRYTINGIGYDIGASAQPSDTFHIALPYIGIRYDQSIKKTPIIPYVAGGVGLMLPIFSDIGPPYVAYIARYGIQYHATSIQRWWIEHRIQFRTNKHATSFNGNALVIGASFHPPMLRLRQPYSPPVPKRSPSLQQRPSINPSIHQQTQSIMKDLSWPTY